MDTYAEEFSVRVVRECHSDRIVSKAYYDDRMREHRTGDKPSFVEFDPASGNPIYIHYAIHGEEHREGGKSSFQLIDPRTNVISYERWLEHGRPRDNGVTVIERDPQTGDVISVIRRENGREIEDRFGPWLDTSTPQP